MQDRKLDTARVSFTRQQWMAISLLIRRTASVLVELMKIPRVVGLADLKWPDEGVLEKGKVCEILRQGGLCGVGKGLPVKSVCGDLLEKNEYLRAVNEEIIKLTLSLDATNTELETTRDYLDNLIQNSADMIVSTSRGPIITLFNRRAEEVLGYKSDEVPGQPVDILYEAREAQRIEKHLRQQPDGKLMEYEIRLRTKGGLTIPARLTASLLYDRSG